MVLSKKKRAERVSRQRKVKLISSKNLTFNKLYSNREIAVRLSASVKTVEAHKANTDAQSRHRQPRRYRMLRNSLGLAQKQFN